MPKTTAISETLNDVSKIGLTEAVRIVLRANGGWMTPQQIRDQIRKLGIDLSRYQNPLASIHTILDRLIDKEIELDVLETPKQRAARRRGEEVKAKAVVRWKGPPETVWERLQKIPRDKADEIVKHAAEGISKEQIRKVVMSDIRKRKKKE
jgi:hypothetical protein